MAQESSLTATIEMNITPEQFIGNVQQFLIDYDIPATLVSEAHIDTQGRNAVRFTWSEAVDPGDIRMACSSSGGQDISTAFEQGHYGR